MFEELDILLKRRTSYNKQIKIFLETQFSDYLLENIESLPIIDVFYHRSIGGTIYGLDVILTLIPGELSDKFIFMGNLCFIESLKTSTLLRFYTKDYYCDNPVFYNDQIKEFLYSDSKIKEYCQEFASMIMF